MTARRLAAAGMLLAAVLAGPLGVTATSAPAPAGWAVLVEYNSYNGQYPELPVGYVNSARMLDALARLGWPPDHILLVRDSRDPAVLRHALAWLAGRVRAEDTALFYLAGEYQFFDRDLAWGTTVPALWRRVKTPHRVLIVETCFAERLTAPVAGMSGLGLPAVGRDELDWWGLRDAGPVIRGGSFTYFLARALERQPADGPPDFAGAFVTAVAGAREYFRGVVAAIPDALGSFHARNSYPERLATFPNPHLVEDAGGRAAAP